MGVVGQLHRRRGFCTAIDDRQRPLRFKALHWQFRHDMVETKINFYLSRADCTV
jgi:hypothetical protein